MPGSQELKEDLKFNSELMDLLKIMKNVAVFQYRSLLKKRERFVRLSELLSGFFRMFDVSKSPHGFIHPKIDKPALIMITSNEGFMGDLNFQVVDSAILRAGSGEAEYFVIGESGERYLRDTGKQYTAFKGAADAEGRCVLAKELKEHITKGMAEGRFGRVSVFFPNPVSFLLQKVEEVELFPLTALFSSESKVVVESGPIMESPEGGIIEYLAEAFVENKLIELLEDSKLSEFAARAVHLERSGQELVDKKKHLHRQYLHAFHELVDKNTRELFSSQIIIKHKADVPEKIDGEANGNGE
ncbi:MAG: F0F1 ATP synthase subunit gamma [Candidatus Omnitrophica bacterium]|nr:F0F1 ATP synthase subunit gamma [Candidatus Omnitrophota bacterium]